MAPRPFGITGDEYWTAPWKNLDALASGAVRDDAAGLTIDLPETIVPGAHSTTPLLVLHADDRRKMADAPFKHAGIVAAIHLPTNRLRARAACTPDEPFRPPSNPPAWGFCAREFKVDLNTTGVLHPNEPGTYLINAIIRDRLSNRLPLTIGHPPNAFQDAEVSKFLAAQRAKLPASTVRPEESDSAIYGDPANCPPLPEKEGIALAAERVVVLDNDSKAFLHASFRLPLFTNDIVADPTKTPDGVKKRLPNRGPCTGIVGISLLVVGADDNAPRVIRLDVPVFSKLEGTPERPLGVGHFKFDLLTNEQILMSPQTYFIYAFSHDFMSGPIACAIVPESALPKAR
jgi:hypothetical protein